MELRTIARGLFALAFVGTQLGLVLSADARPDRVFGFRMFNESSSLKFELYRRVKRGRARRLVRVEGGAWQAKTKRGGLESFRWGDRVRYGSLTRTGEFVHAAYGLDAQLFRLQHALDDVAAHLGDEAETEALVARVELVQNGRPAGRRELVGVRR